MRAAYHLASQSLPEHTCKFSRKDYTLPQLFACLAVKELLKRSYREAEAVLADADSWLRDVGLAKAPDHGSTELAEVNTLQRAAKFLMKSCRVGRLLDRVAQWAAVARILGLSRKPLAVDSTCFESRHRSRHYEQRRRPPAASPRPACRSPPWPRRPRSRPTARTSRTGWRRCGRRVRLGGPRPFDLRWRTTRGTGESDGTIGIAPSRREAETQRKGGSRDDLSLLFFAPWPLGVFARTVRAGGRSAKADPTV